MIDRKHLFIFAAATLIFACSEAADDDKTTTTTTTSSGMGGSSTTSSGMGGSSTTGSGMGGGSAGGLNGVVINEISAAGDDYIELYNPGDSDVELGDLKVADDDMGKPKAMDAVTIPMGTKIKAKGYYFILADVKDAKPGEQMMCSPGPSPCIHASWGLSKGKGDKVYILDASDKELASEAYPPNAVPDGQTWGRLPNGSGSFKANKPTPGKENAAP